jgi:hypothetical protein
MHYRAAFWRSVLSEVGPGKLPLLSVLHDVAELEDDPGDRQHDVNALGFFSLSRSKKTRDLSEQILAVTERGSMHFSGSATLDAHFCGFFLRGKIRKAANERSRVACSQFFEADLDGSGFGETTP